MVSMSNDNDDKNEEDNNYVKTNAYVLDMLNTRARKKIRQRGGLLTTEHALKLVMKEDKQEIIDDVASQLREGSSLCWQRLT